MQSTVFSLHTMQRVASLLICSLPRSGVRAICMRGIPALHCSMPTLLSKSFATSANANQQCGGACKKNCSDCHSELAECPSRRRNDHVLELPPLYGLPRPFLPHLPQDPARLLGGRGRLQFLPAVWIVVVGVSVYDTGRKHTISIQRSWRPTSRTCRKSFIRTCFPPSRKWTVIDCCYR